MTESEAIKELHKIRPRGGIIPQKRAEALDVAIQALEKQIPKKPIFDYNLSDTLSKFHCECGKTIKVNHDAGIMDNNDAPNYCSDCGQKLDWSEESEE
jgi:hypothetical protein